MYDDSLTSRDQQISQDVDVVYEDTSVQRDSDETSSNIAIALYDYQAGKPLFDKNRALDNKIELIYNIM